MTNLVIPAYEFLLQNTPQTHNQKLYIIHTINPGFHRVEKKNTILIEQIVPIPAFIHFKSKMFEMGLRISSICVALTVLGLLGIARPFAKKVILVTCQ